MNYPNVSRLRPNHYPTVESHALAMLEAMGGDFQEAIAFCLINCEFAANDLNSIYWFDMAMVLETAEQKDKRRSYDA